MQEEAREMNSDDLNKTFPPYAEVVTDADMQNINIPHGMTIYGYMVAASQARAIYFANMIEQREKERLN